MSALTSDTVTRDRLVLSLIGALSGAAAWALVEVLPDLIQNDRLFMLIAALIGGFFSAFLVTIGPLTYARAAIAAGCTSVPAAVLLLGASFRYAQVGDFLETGHPLVAYSLIFIIGLPFLIAAQHPDQDNGGGWKSYPMLFSQAWNMVVRSAAAWVFVGVVWAVIMLSNALLGLVGLTVIEDLLDLDPVPYLLTGAVLGLALAVVVELSDFISPYLILRLMRLLLPVVLLVTLVFLVALPVQGLSDLFGGLSAAATLLAMAVGIATLITSALDRDDEEATLSRLLQLSARLLALALPALAALAVYAIWLRVADYGWTPTRIAAVSLAGIVLGYGTLYALAVLSRRRWMTLIRRANIAMALVTILVSVLWLSPVLNPERISAQDQLARITNGDISPDQADLWHLGRDLGRAGEAAIAQLAASSDPAIAELQADIERLQAARNRYEFTQVQRQKDVPDLVAQITAVLTIRPEGAQIPATLFDEVEPRLLENWAESCAMTTPAGHPGCILLQADLLPKEPGPEMLFVRMRTGDRVALHLIEKPKDGVRRAQIVFVSGDVHQLGPAALDQIRAGTIRAEPLTIPALSFGDTSLFIRP